MSKTQPIFWRWEKTVLEDELTITATSFFDRERDIVVIKPDERESDEYYDADDYIYASGTRQTDQLNAEWDNELILSKRLEHCFTGLQDRDVTVRPVEMHLNDGTIDCESWVHISIVGRVQAMDYKQSIYTRDGNRIDSIESLILNDTNIARSGMHIFRLYDFQEWILVSDELKNALEALNTTGMTFLPINKPPSSGLFKKWF